MFVLRFVDFTLEKDAEHAVKELSGQALLGNIVQLTRYVSRVSVWYYRLTGLTLPRRRLAARKRDLPSRCGAAHALPYATNANQVSHHQVRGQIVKTRGTTKGAPGTVLCLARGIVTTVCRLTRLTNERP